MSCYVTSTAGSGCGALRFGCQVGVRETLNPKPKTLLEWGVRRIHGAGMDAKKSMEASWMAFGVRTYV